MGVWIRRLKFGNEVEGDRGLTQQQTHNPSVCISVHRCSFTRPLAKVPFARVGKSLKEKGENAYFSSFTLCPFPLNQTLLPLLLDHISFNSL